MLGPFVLAAPVVVPGVRTRRLDLPAGPQAWFDFYDGTEFAAGADVEVPAPLERLPLLVRAGAIIPMTGEEAGFAASARRAIALPATVPRCWRGKQPFHAG